MLRDRRKVGGQAASTTSAHGPSPSAPISTSLKTQATHPPSVRERARKYPTAVAPPISRRSHKDVDDGSQVGPLLDQVDGPVASVTGDGAYDRDDVYAAVAARHPAAAVVVPPRANAAPSDAAETAPTQRDAHLRCIAERGRMGWQRASGYGWRALVESDISRWKRVVGDGLRFQTDGRQATEVAIAADVLNRMLDLGRPEYVRTA